MELLENLHWQPPSHWAKINTIEMHTGGEPLRIIISGLPEIKGRSILEKRRYFKEHFDSLRTGLLWEPRGHADMYGAIVSNSINADFDVFFIHNEGYSTMCGHAIIALTKMMLDTEIIKRKGEAPVLIINAPCGKIEATGFRKNGKVETVSFRNVPSFLYLRDLSIELDGIGTVMVDIAYGGAFYAFANADTMNLPMEPTEYNRLIDFGRRIKKAVMKNIPITHPFEDDLSFLYGTIFTGKPNNPAHHSRNVCVFADGEVDRSATGSGVSARAALHFSKGEISMGESITIESILGSTMSVKVIEQLPFGRFDAIIPEVTGTASFTGKHEFYFDPEDPFRNGFIFR